MSTPHPSQEKLEAFAFGEIEGEDAAIVRAHVVGCAPCEGDVALYRAERALFADRAAASPAEAPSLAEVMRRAALVEAEEAREAPQIPVQMPAARGPSKEARRKPQPWGRALSLGAGALAAAAIWIFGWRMAPQDARVPIAPADDGAGEVCGEYTSADAEASYCGEREGGHEAKAEEACSGCEPTCDETDEMGIEAESVTCGAGRP